MKGLRRLPKHVTVMGVLTVVGAWTLQGQETQNLAAAAAGGRLVFFSSEYNETDWKADQLIDGSADKGWAGKNSGAQAFVIAFADNGLAEIEDVVINPYSREDKSNWAKEVEIQVSTTYPFRDFQSAGTFTLKNEGTDQVFSFPKPTRARYLKIVFLSNYGGGYMEAGEVKAMGKMVRGAAPAPSYTNVAAAKNGARVESYTSQYNETDWAAANLIAPDGGNQWAGKSAGSQEVVVALPQAVAISDVAVNNYAREDPKNWAREVDAEVSASSPYKGYQRIGQLSMAPVGDLHTVSLSAPMTAKYVKFVFRSNGGGGYMEAARVYVFQTEGGGGGRLLEQLKATGRAVSHEINFATSSADILPSSAAVLTEIADLLRGNADWELIIEGHTDNVGGAQANLELSRKRADAVKRWLVDRLGISEIRLTTVGYGMTKPIADNATEEGRAQNRRVELVRR